MECAFPHCFCANPGFFIFFNAYSLTFDGVLKAIRPPVSRTPKGYDFFVLVVSSPLNRGHYSKMLQSKINSFSHK